MGQKNSTTVARRYKHLTEHERFMLEGCLAAKMKPKEIAEKIGKHVSTIYREILRGTIDRIGPELVEYSTYRANVAQADYRSKVANRERPLKIGKDKALEGFIREGVVEKQFSPDVVIGIIKRQGLKFLGMICVKTLYNYIDRGIFSGISNKHLWRKRNKTKQKYRPLRRANTLNRTGKSIEDRDTAIEERKEVGHWEGDTVKGPRGSKSGALTLTERATRKEIAIKISGATQVEVKRAIDGLERQYGETFAETFKTITFDNGMEFLDSEALELSCVDAEKKRTQVYYAHPYSSWERGTNENHNGMLRRFFPKGTIWSKVAKRELNAAVDWMNNYPRKILGYRTPNELVLELAGNRALLS